MELSGVESLRMQDTSARPAPHAIVRCLLCGDPFMMLPYIGEPDQICPRCAKDYEEMARVICSKCRVTIARLHPGITESGYVVRPKTVLHVDACNICRPGLQVSTILEVAEWERLYRPKKIISVSPVYK